MYMHFFEVDKQSIQFLMKYNDFVAYEIDVGMNQAK